MGGRLARFAARQHADLTAPSPQPGASHWVSRIMLAVLAFDGVLSALVGALFLPLYVGAVPMPVSAVLSGLLNAALVWAALQWTSTILLAGGPLWSFVVTVGVLTLGGPGGDVVFGANGMLRFLMFVAVGVVPPAVLLWRRQARAAGPTR